MDSLRGQTGLLSRLPKLRLVVFLFLAVFSVKVVLYQSLAYEAAADTRAVGRLEARPEEVEGAEAGDLPRSPRDRLVLRSRWASGGGSAWWGKGAGGESKGGSAGDGSASQFRGDVAKLHMTSHERRERSARAHANSGAKSKMASPAKSDEFDSEKVLQLFRKCKQEDGELLIECYNNAYEELCKLFKPLGTIFNFVTSDIVEKIGILREYQKGEQAEHFKTIQTMIRYEVENDLTNQKKKASGSRTLLRLHRALEFISALLTKIHKTDNSCKFSSEASAAYDDTLAKHHPWLIKKAVHMAMYTLPDRKTMLNKMKIEDTEAGMATIQALIEQLNSMFDITQKLYADNNLLDLP